MYKCICSFLLIFLSGIVFSQGRNEAPFKTPNTHIEPTPDPKKDKPKRKELNFVIKKDTKGYLPGNKCFEEVTTDMGFIYLAVPKGQSYYTSEFDRNLHNFGAKIKILVKNGPFWKIKVNKTYKKCNYGYADYAAP